MREQWLPSSESGDGHVSPSLMTRVTQKGHFLLLGGIIKLRMEFSQSVSLHHFVSVKLQVFLDIVFYAT